MITNAILLVNSGVEIEGLRIWGSPVTTHSDTAFGIDTPEGRRRHWEAMPAGLDILITHGPPHAVLDQDYGSDHHGGDPELREAVIAKRPRLHIFGHVHGAMASVRPLIPFS